MTNPILLITTCKKCGKPLLTAKCSLYGNNNVKLKFDRSCSQCITEEQLQEILNQIERGNNMKKYSEILIERIENITGGERFITETQLEELNELVDIYVEDCGESGTGRGKWYDIYEMNEECEPTGDKLAEVVVDVRL